MKFKVSLVVAALLLGSVWFLQDEIQLNHNQYGIQDVSLFGNKYLVTNEFDDGPYQFYAKQQIKHIDIVRGQVETKWINSPLRPAPRPATSDTYAGVKKYAALSDIHGQFNDFVTLLTQGGVIDEQQNWIWGEGHLVITGDIFDRGDEVTEALWLVKKIEQQAQDAGGKVHYLLGNHEYMVLMGDDRYIHKKYLKSAELVGMSHQQLYDSNSVLGRWLRSKPTIIKLNDAVFLHGGIHPDMLKLNLSLEQINQHFRDSIDLNKTQIKADPLLAFLRGRNGPIWYRGYFKEDLTQAQVNELLAKLDAQKIIVGHTSMDKIETRYDDRILAIDTSIKKGNRGELLIWQDQQYQRVALSGSRSSLF